MLGWFTGTRSIIQDKLNNKPRKLLGYKTPNEIYEAVVPQ
jgi:IS30 family transposase